MTLFPASTNDAYTGARSAVWFLGLCAVLTLAPGAIHSFLPDGGAGVIAGLDMGEQRRLVVSIFAWQGATQLTLGFAMLAVAIRYRSLTPLFLLLLAFERGLMSLQAWILKPGTGHHPPEHYASPVTAVLALVFLAIALRPAARAAA